MPEVFMMRADATTKVSEDVAMTLKRSGDGGTIDAVSYMLKTRCGSDTYIKWDGKVGTAGKGALVSEDVSFTLAASQDQTLVQPRRYIVRRLMPVEGNRLQAFPDGHDDITGCDVDEVTRLVSEALKLEEGSKEYKKLRRNIEKWSEKTPDTPRYKAMGNSMTTYVIEIIGRRIQAYDELFYGEVGNERL